MDQNDSEAIRYYRLAADQGNPDAEVSLGFLIAHGRGASQDLEVAVAWYRKAARKDSRRPN